MNFIKRYHKILKLSFIALITLLIAPIMLGKLGFYKDSFAAANNANAPIRANSNRFSYANAVDLAAPAVVSIQTSKEIPIEINPFMQDPFFRFFFGDQGLEKEFPKQKRLHHTLGSGVIINNKGHILTNNHVIKDATEISVKLFDGRTAEAKVIGKDQNTDLAILQIKLKNLPAIKIGNSNDLKVGDIVLAIGNPFGLSRTVTQGIVSAIGSISERSDEQTQTQIGNALIDNLIQTDAAINPGNSGGALIDSNGELIGINMAIITRTGGSQGIGFAIPVDLAKDIMQQLIETGHIVRGYLGINLGSITEDIKKYLEYKGNQGVYVQATVNNGPAQKAGILPGDIITKINKVKINSPTQTIQLVTTLKPKKAYPIEVFRRGEYLTFSVIISERPKE